MPGFETLEDLKALIEECRRSDVKFLKLPSGVELHIDTKAAPRTYDAQPADSGEF